MPRKEKDVLSREKRRCTIYDVARYAQVAPSTVSHVLNGTASISENTKVRIYSAVSALGYQPNANARALRQPHSNLIGVIFPDIASEYYAMCTASIIQQAQQKQYVVLTNDLHFDNRVLESSIPALIERRVDGLIFVGGKKDEVYLKKAADTGVPIVLGDRFLEGYPCVEFNNEDTMHRLVSAFYDMGYRRFGYAGQVADSQQNIERRYAGFLEGLKANDISLEDTLIVMDESMNYTDKVVGAYRYFCDYFAQADRSKIPQVILTANDLIAVGVMKAALHIGLHVPDDLAVVGFDNIALSMYCTPSITTVVQKPYQLGDSCFNLLMKKMAGEACDNIMLSQQIAVRNSAPISTECLKKNGLEAVQDEEIG